MEDGLRRWNKLYLVTAYNGLLSIHEFYFFFQGSVFVSTRDGGFQFLFSQFLCSLYQVLKSGAVTSGNELGKACFSSIFCVELVLICYQTAGTILLWNDMGLESSLLEILKL